VDQAHRAAFNDLERMATAIYCHSRSAGLQVAFVRNRAGADAQPRARIMAILEEEKQLAVTLHNLARLDSHLGFEVTNHYAYTSQDLHEKALNCEALRSLWTVKSA
jgi:hypothetical protein